MSHTVYFLVGAVLGWTLAQLTRRLWRNRVDRIVTRHAGDPSHWEPPEVVIPLREIVSEVDELRPEYDFSKMAGGQRRATKKPEPHD
jgi:hypothetical protein